MGERKYFEELVEEKWVYTGEAREFPKTEIRRKNGNIQIVETGEMHWEPDGKGVIWGEGFRREGEFAEGIQIGRGTCEFSDRYSFSGTFSKGCPEEGEMKLTSGEVLTGAFVNGKLRGLGSIVFSDGSTARGDFRENEIRDVIIEKADGTLLKADNLNVHGSGEAAVTWPDGSSCFCHISLWKLDGKTVILTPEGKKQQVRFHNDIILTRKTVPYKGGVYEGMCAGDQPFGKGKWTTEGGDIYEGEFREDGFAACKGKVTFADGGSYSGDLWQDGINGQGKYTWPDGDVFIGSFSSGKPYSSGRFIHNGQNNFVSDISAELKKLGKK